MFDALRGADVPLNYVMNFYRAARIKQMWEPNKDRLSDKQKSKNIPPLAQVFLRDICSVN